MFNAQQLTYLRVLASQSAGNAQVGFNRTRLLVRIGARDEDRAASLLFLFLAGILLSLFFGICLLTSEWVMAAFIVVLLTGIGWGVRRVLTDRVQAQQQPPDFIFDSTHHCFYVLVAGLKGAEPHYERYPSQLLVATRVRILRSDAYFDDTVIEFSFGNNQWVKVLELNNSPLAYELERAVKYCQALAQA